MRRLVLATCLSALLAACGPTGDLGDPYGGDPSLPAPAEQGPVPVVNVAEAVGWPDGAAPTAPDGFTVTRYAEDLDHPRWMHLLPNGDVLVAESSTEPEPGGGIRGFVMRMLQRRGGALNESADRITLLRDADGDGVVETRSLFLENLNQPFGMALVGDTLYVGNTDGVVAFPYRTGQTSIEAEGRTIASFPGASGHWTRNLLASEDGRRLYVTIGSKSNIGDEGMEVEEGRALIREIDLSTGQSRVFASGLRNANGLDREPSTGVMWTVVNERDLLGDDLVPDYMTRVRDGDFYGWPWSYWGQTVDTRVQPANPEMVARALTPDYALGAHTASLGLVFAREDSLTPEWRNGVFIGQHGSWNRSEPVGYKVVFVRFANGMPTGRPVDFLTGFLDREDRAFGRPVGVAFDRTGALLVADDAGDIVWRVAPSQALPRAPA